MKKFVFILLLVSSGAWSQTTITGGGAGDVINFNSNPILNNGIYIRQAGNNDVVGISQIGDKNLIGGVNEQFAKIQDSNNYISIKQGTGNPGKNEINLSVTGGSNNLYLVNGSDPAGVSGGNNYQLVNIAGFNNSVTASQTNSGGEGHFLELAVTGNSNTVGIIQNNDGQKQLYAMITGNLNTLTTTQSGTGQHLLTVNMTGNGNSAVVNQGGSLANTASITLINAGAPASVDLSQGGGKNYSITQTCYTTCGTVTIRQ